LLFMWGGGPLLALDFPQRNERGEVRFDPGGAAGRGQVFLTARPETG